MTHRRFSHWPSPSDDLQTLLLLIPPAKIGLVCSLLEAYEGVAVVRTTDREAGLVDLWIMPGQVPVVDSILAELEQQFRIQRVSVKSGHPDLADDPAR